MRANTPDRYQRQRILPQIGKAGQDRLGRSRVLLIGCGALGTVLADLLIRAGVGFLRIIDRDLIELGNLQRQVLFDESDAQAEMPKAVAAARRLAQINSSVNVDPIVADVNPSNIESLAKTPDPFDLILDGTDNVATRYLINDVAIKHRIPWLYGACVGVGGRVMTIIPGKTACLRCVFPDPPDASQLPTCDTAGVLGSASSAVASLQATLAIRALIGSPLPGLITFDTWNPELRIVESTRQPQADCPCCAGKQFPFLSTPTSQYTTKLCGSQSVQVQHGNGKVELNLAIAAERLASVGNVQTTPWFVRCQLNDPPEITLTLFSDGRLLVRGTSDLMRAKSFYARFVGT